MPFGGNVADNPGNDFPIGALSFNPGADYRPYLESRGVPYSTLAGAQVEAHVASGHIRQAADTALYAPDTALPQLELTAGLQTVALDGLATRPGDGWHPWRCP